MWGRAARATALGITIGSLLAASLVVAAPRRRTPSPQTLLIWSLARSLKAASLPIPTQQADIRIARAALRLAARIGENELYDMVVSDASIAHRVGLSAPLANEMFLELQVNITYLRGHGSYPRPASRVTVGDFIYERYSGQGLRLQPLASFWLMRDIARHRQQALLVRMLDDGLTISTTRAGAVSTAYLFDFGGGTAPWRSPMADALAMDAYARGWRLTNDARYLKAALGFAQDAANTALTDNGEAWFPIYPFAPDQRVLNGDMQVLIGLFALRGLPGADAFVPLRSRAIATLARVLPQYAFGNWSRYDLSSLAPLAYHQLMTEQLKELAQLTRKSIIRVYAARFAADLVQPPVVTGPAQAPPPFYPWRADGVNNSALISFRIDKPSAVTLVIRDASGSIVDRLDEGIVDGPVFQASWTPGRIPAGVYRVDVVATDLAGNTSRSLHVTDLTAIRITTPPVITKLTYTHHRLMWRVHDTATVWVTLRVRTRAGLVVLSQVPLSGSASLDHPPLRVLVIDSSGNASLWPLPHP